MTVDRFLGRHPWLRASAISVCLVVGISLLLTAGVNLTGLNDARASQRAAEDLAAELTAKLQRRDARIADLERQLRAAQERMDELERRLTGASGADPAATGGSDGAGTGSSTPPQRKDGTRPRGQRDPAAGGNPDRPVPPKPDAEPTEPPPDQDVCLLGQCVDVPLIPR